MPTETETAPAPKPDAAPAPTLASDRMELQDARCLLYPGHDVFIKSCTPAQYFVLTKLHAEGAKVATPVSLTGKVLGYAQSIDKIDDENGKPTYRPRTAREEVARMKQMYGGQVDKQGRRVIDKLFPDDNNPKVPMTFKEAIELAKPVPVTQAAIVDVGAATDIPGPMTDTTKSPGANKPKP